jgi:hypothetical protein
MQDEKRSKRSEITLRFAVNGKEYTARRTFYDPPEEGRCSRWCTTSGSREAIGC